jgi:hypothetical protein
VEIMITSLYKHFYQDIFELQIVYKTNFYQEYSNKNVLILTLISYLIELHYNNMEENHKVLMEYLQLQNYNLRHEISFQIN